jgi:casein kinase 1
MILYFARGSLPWQGLHAKTDKEKYEKIGQKKQTITVKELCDGLPDEFEQYLTYVRGLQFEEDPNYDLCRSFFQQGKSG